MSTAGGSSSDHESHKAWYWDWRPAGGILPQAACELTSLLRPWLSTLHQQQAPCSEDCLCKQFESGLMFEFNSDSGSDSPGTADEAARPAPTPQALGVTAGLLADLTAVVIVGNHDSSALSVLTESFEGCVIGLHYWGDNKTDAALQMALAVGKSSLLPALARNLLTLQTDLAGSLGVETLHTVLDSSEYSEYASDDRVHNARDTLRRAASVFDFMRCIPVVWPGRVVAAPKLAPVFTATADAAFEFLAATALLVHGFQHRRDANLKYHMPGWWRSHCSSAFQLLSVLVLELAQMMREHEGNQLPPAAVIILQSRETMLWNTAVLLLNVHGAQFARSLSGSLTPAAGVAQSAAAATRPAEHKHPQTVTDPPSDGGSSSGGSDSSSRTSSCSLVSSVQLQSEGQLLCYADKLQAGSQQSQLVLSHIQQWLVEYGQHWQELGMPPELHLALTEGCELDQGSPVVAADSSQSQGLSASGDASHCSSSTHSGSTSSTSSGDGSTAHQSHQLLDCLLLVQGAAMVIRYITAHGSVKQPAALSAGHDVQPLSTVKAVSQSLKLLLLRTAAAASNLSPVQALPTVISCLRALSALDANLGPYSEGPSTAKGSSRGSNGPGSSSSSSTTGSSSRGAVSSKGKTVAQREAQQNKQPSGTVQASEQNTLSMQQQQLGGVVQVLQLLLGLGRYSMHMHRLQHQEQQEEPHDEPKRSEQQQQQQEEQQQAELKYLTNTFYAIRMCLEKLPRLLGLQLQQLTNSCTRGQTSSGTASPAQHAQQQQLCQQLAFAVQTLEAAVRFLSSAPAEAGSNNLQERYLGHLQYVVMKIRSQLH